MLKKIGRSLRDQAKGAIKEAKLKARSHLEPQFGREELAQGMRSLGLEAATPCSCTRPSRVWFRRGRTDRSVRGTLGCDRS